MQEYTVNLYEALALITSVVLGTGAYIGTVHLKKKDKINLTFIISVFFINFFVTYVLSEFLKSKGWGEIRGYSLPLVACSGVYFMEWLDKRYLNIFDAGAKKVGWDLTENKENNNYNYNEENTEINNYEEGDIK